MATRDLLPGVTGVLALADGTVLQGLGVGAVGEAVGEVCFNTAMTGYQEILTDPSYMAQIVAFTFPHVGNVGTNVEDIEQMSGSAETAARVAEDRATRGGLGRPRHLLDVFDVGPDVADVGEGEGDDLGHVGGVREDLLVASHGGVEADLADGVADGADADALQDGPVRQGQHAGDAGQQIAAHGQTPFRRDDGRKKAGRGEPPPAAQTAA